MWLTIAYLCSRLLVVANLIADTRNSIGTFHFLYTCPTLSSDRNTDKERGYFIFPLTH